MGMRRGRGRWWVAGLVLTNVVGSAPALAQQKAAPATAPEAQVATGAPGGPDAADREREAARLYEEGVKAAKAGKWEQARQLILTSFRLKPTAAKAANLGKVELRAGQPRDAAEHLTFFLREAPQITPDDRQATEEMLAEAKGKIGTVTVLVEAGAELLVDGQPVGTAPLAGPVFLEPGDRRFEARKQGMRPATQEVQVAAGTAPVVELMLVRSERLPSTEEQVTPGAAPVAERAAIPSKAAGTGAGASSATTTRASGDAAVSSWRRSAVWVGAGLTATGIGIGVGFSVAARANDSAAIGERDQLVRRTLVGRPICKGTADPRCATLFELTDARDLFENVAIAGFVVGGVAAAGTLAAALWASGPPGQEAQKKPTLVIAPFLRGVAAAGTF